MVSTVMTLSDMKKAAQQIREDAMARRLALSDEAEEVKKALNEIEVQAAILYNAIGRATMAAQAHARRIG